MLSATRAFFQSGNNLEWLGVYRIRGGRATDETHAQHAILARETKALAQSPPIAPALALPCRLAALQAGITVGTGLAIKHAIRPGIAQ
jgi:hypothetical protein